MKKKIPYLLITSVTFIVSLVSSVVIFTSLIDYFCYKTTDFWDVFLIFGLFLLFPGFMALHSLFCFIKTLKETEPEFHKNHP
jgi:hypothetical protein